jgi:uncharacterized membrane protein
MNWYTLCVIVHLFAVFFWLGHMFFWSLVIGPFTKRFEPPETGQIIRQMSLRWGGLGWPALFALAITGVIMLLYRGVTLQRFLSGELFSTPFGRVLEIKLLLVTLMTVYQVFVGHRSAPRLVFVNMMVALLIVALSIILIRAPSIF